MVLGLSKLRVITAGMDAILEVGNPIPGEGQKGPQNTQRSGRQGDELSRLTPLAQLCTVQTMGAVEPGMGAPWRGCGEGAPAPESLGRGELYQWAAHCPSSSPSPRPSP